ncbi:MAG: hypothetical protein RR747_04000 [Gordonibacter sp.]
MPHLIRKPFAPLLCAAGAACIVVICLPCMPLCAQAAQDMQDAGSWNTGNLGGIIGTPEDAGGPEDSEGANEPDNPAKPTGEIVQVLKGGAIANIYLPELTYPLFNSDESEHPPLQTLRIERVDAANVGTWTTGALCTWDPEYAYYHSEDELAYLVNVSDDTCMVLYTEPDTDFRDFYVRITATFLLDGQEQAVTYDPVLLAFPDSLKPQDDPEKPGTGNPDGSGSAGPGGVNEGEIGGNRGGVTLGESERVNPESSPLDLLPSVEQADAAPVASGTATPSDDNAAKPANGSEGTPEPGEGTARGGSLGRDDATAAAADGTDRLPGFAVAVGATVAVALGAGIIFASRKGVARRFKGSRP